MKKSYNFGCTLLKLERVRQNKGQKEVCYGICVPSYLSKIEHNQVVPDSAILTQLFQRLGIEYHCDISFVQKYSSYTDLYFEQLYYNLDKTAYLELEKEDQALNYSPLAIDWMLVKGFEEDKTVLPQLQQCQDNMSNQQLAFYYLLQRLEKDTVEQVIPLYTQSYYILNNSFSLLALMMAHFIAGQYDKVYEFSDKCISLALEEGNTCNLANCYQLIATVYACLNAEELMFPFYKRAIHLLQNTNWKGQLNGIYYNIGATLISTKKYEEALHYLNMVQEDYTIINIHTDSFLLHHKKALAYIRSNRKDEGVEYINNMRQCLLAKEQNKNTSNDEQYVITLNIERMMLEEAIYECNDNHLDDPNFIVLLEHMMEVLKKNRHKGYSIFYRDILKDAYCSQRKYKKALELFEEISLNL